MSSSTKEIYAKDAAQRAARTLVTSRLSGDMFTGLLDDERPPTLADGYLVQRVAREILPLHGFGRQGGWKIGCTTEVMQKYLDVAAPLSGTMFRHSMWSNSHQFKVAAPRVLGVECELAVRVGTDFPSRNRPYSNDEVAASVVASMAAIEVVEDRYVDYRALDTATLVADDFFHLGCVLGTPNETQDPRELGKAVASMTINGAEVGQGKGVDILGEPMTALAWLANNCAELDTPMLAGDVVLLGSLVQTQWVAPGDVVIIHNDLLGEASASFATLDSTTSEPR
jgi:2-oxo-3-hexenedioate decarboxylase/2-keto-4-pentenoate hydratase